MPKTPLTHHLVAIWFADIAGYSDRAAEDERSALQLIEILQSLSRDTVRRYEGRVVKFMGDAVLAEFPSTELAVRAAAALSEQYAKESAGTGRGHNLRVGVHVADVAVGPDGDLYGDGVNAAARVQEAAEPGQVGKRRGVERLLGGSIRKAGNRLRIIVQLVDARNGYHLWSERFDREIEDIFAIQDEIARRVLDALGLSLTEREERRFLKPSTANVKAYEFYLRGRKLFHSWTRQNMEFARQMFLRAVAIDPDFALAWAGLANTYVDLYRWGRNSRDLEEGQRTSAHALKLDPNLAEAHVAIGQALAIQRQFKDAAAEFERAIELDPTLYDAYYFYARSSFEAGDLEKAVQLFEKAHRSRPEDYQAMALRALALHELGRADEMREADQQAVDLINKYLELNPNEARAYSLGASPLARLGESKHSMQWSEQAMALAPNDPVVLYNAACNLAQLGEHDRTLDGLRRSIGAGRSV